MTEITRKLETFFKRKEANPKEDDGDEGSRGEYWEFANSKNVKCWNLELIWMSN